MNIVNVTALAIATLLIGGCADTPLADADFGESVRQMVQAQTLDPAAASNPPALAPAITDGARLEKALEIYRQDVAKGIAEVKQPVVFEIGSKQ
ncbi:hypothetical protein JM946_15200 [Steroidobacter sp. S1-65]|uniref:Lipoprotein n=1 Tax=Steroidobacter gossypii TaxID=2805490 RepID=A0ABS1WYM2_9GAMM|nr:hypothetical protein [Steroidobacter gossypii]MBM0106079.1 hypothetical protein [Steroidobacter gossypii]